MIWSVPERCDTAQLISSASASRNLGVDESKGAFPFNNPVPDVTPSPIPAATVIRGGTEAHLVLAQALSSSGDRRGEEIRAYLVDPIDSGSVPSGVVFVGRVAAGRRDGSGAEEGCSSASQSSFCPTPV